jgi:nicotinamidase-related amidase
MYTLVVVDMQPGFTSACRKRVRINCLREVRKAYEAGAFIIFLELDGYQSTFFDLLSAAEGHFIILDKFSDDGSKEVEREVRRNKRSTNFKVCGINTDCCVASTVRGLTARFPMSTIEVIADACDSDHQHHAGLQTMKQLSSNVKIV